jgi:hypothetical protein
MKYVKGDSEDYVYPHSNGYIEDYGKISDKGLVELIYLYWKTDDTLFKEHVLKRLAERLGVKLRKQPTDGNEAMNHILKRCKTSRIQKQHPNKLKRHHSQTAQTAKPPKGL